MGLFFNNLGVPRAAGQMFGYLMVCDPAEQSSRQITEAIGLSAASISSSARVLIQVGAVEPRHRMGDRKTYYRLRSDFWLETAGSKLSAFDELAVLGRQIQADGSITSMDRVDEMVAFTEFWHEELPKMSARWKERKASIGKGA